MRHAKIYSQWADTDGFFAHDPDIRKHKAGRHRFSAHGVVLWQALQLVVDLPFLLMALVVFGTGISFFWRVSLWFGCVPTSVIKDHKLID